MPSPDVRMPARAAEVRSEATQANAGRFQPPERTYTKPGASPDAGPPCASAHGAESLRAPASSVKTRERYLEQAIGLSRDA
jgi:hypothetical protein